ncbi:MAG: hypothetical protein SGCHY_003649 [Lobulomycetales sp.]
MDQSDAHEIPRPERPANEPRDILLKRLEYQVRKRGILETDLLLSTFAHKHMQAMDRNELLEFDDLLEENDWDIYYWATQAKPIPEKWVKSSVLTRLVEHSKNKDRKILRMPDLAK